MKTPSRRAFLKLAANSLIGLSGILGLGGLIRYLSYEMDPAPPAEYDLGPLDDFPPGSRSLLMHIPAVVVRTHEGFTAFSLTCTHLGCTVEFANGQYECPCHGSRYDENGYVTRGPSSKPLKKLKAEVNEENHIILRMN